MKKLGKNLKKRNKTERRMSKIIATLGPALYEQKSLIKLMQLGVNIIRLNMSHGNAQWLRESISLIKDCREKTGLAVAILLDTQGPELRMGNLEKPIYLKKNQKFILSHSSNSKTKAYIEFNDPYLWKAVKKGDKLSLDSGLVILEVEKSHKSHIHVKALNAGWIRSRCHLNTPGLISKTPAITEKDYQDITLGVKLGIDFIALSFVSQASQIQELRDFLKRKKSDVKIIAKIENQVAVDNMFEIMDASDGIMVARGDLGIETPYFELPIVQRKLVKHSVRRGIPVIVATQLLESMMEHPMPTRAEITDVANATYEQADALMLSGETSIGKYPLRCVEVMDQIIRRTEQSGGAQFAKERHLTNSRAILAQSAVSLATKLKAKAILVMTRHGRSVRQAASFRPHRIPIFAFTDHEKTHYQHGLLRGVFSYQLKFKKNFNHNVDEAVKRLKNDKILKKGDRIVVFGDMDLEGELIKSATWRTVK